MYPHHNPQQKQHLQSLFSLNHSFSSMQYLLPTEQSQSIPRFQARLAKQAALLMASSRVQATPAEMGKYIFVP